MDLTKYLCRSSGWFFTLASFQSLSLAERLMAQLLRRSKFGESPLNEQTDESLAQFMNLVNQNELAGYILESIYLLGLESVFRARTINDGGSPADVFSLISRHAALEAIKFEKFDNKFVKFLDLTKALQAQLVWLKGIVTSRTCYTEPSQRLSGDFDCFLDSQFAHELHEILYEDGFRIIGADNGFCNQLVVGPVVSLDNLFLVPEDQFVPSAVMGYFKNRCPILDVKFNPLDRGLKMIELERFKSECTLVNWRGRQFLAPSLIDQLIIALTHLEKDRFLGWKQLLDIKLIAEKINETPDSWSEFVRRCRVEGVSTALPVKEFRADCFHSLSRRFFTGTRAACRCCLPMLHWLMIRPEKQQC
jgi:Uncharacterised nucleotidyltransferase